MKSYVRIYMAHFGYDVSDFIPCEYCNHESADIHHLTPRSIAKDRLNDITNLVAVCRQCHNRAEVDKKFNEELRKIHLKKIK